MSTRLSRLAPVRDAVAATVVLLAAVVAGSRGLRDLDAALLGYLGATLVATFGVVWRMSAFWRRPASAPYARALAVAWRDPARLRAALGAVRRDLVTQGFIARRSRARWSAHLLLSLGTLGAFAITLPLVWGWLHFEAEGQDVYRVIVLGLPVGRFAIAGPLGWLVFHGLALTGVAVTLGAAWFLRERWRTRRLPGATAGFHTAPLLLLLAVALTGLALPATREVPAAFRITAWLHEVTVVVLLVSLPFSKLAHLLIRPLQLGARLVRTADAPHAACALCGGPLAPAAQVAIVERLLAERGFVFDGHQRRCTGCRRRMTAAAQATLVGLGFHPGVVGARPAARHLTDEVA
jgi:hypothetical protein